jgi:hypothetical protein
MHDWPLSALMLSREQTEGDGISASINWICRRLMTMSTGFP